jgi:hypothetical protein
MAFNPFHKFRKHQKAIFAALTIMCMLIFVLGPTGGSLLSGGDFFSNVSRWITGQTRQIDLASIDGKEVTANELHETELKRKAANDFMFIATQMAAGSIQAEIQASMGQNPDRFLMQTHLRNNPDLKKLEELMRRGGGQVYFGGSLKYPAAELIDFMIWKRQAKRLGIALSDKDVVKEVTRLTLGRVKDQDVARITTGLSRERFFKGIWSPEFFMDSLRDEFQVRLAKEVLGYDPSGYQTEKGKDGQPLSPVAAPITPQEFWSFFEDNFKKIDVGLIPVKVEDYVAKVTATPTDKEIQDLYLKYRDKEYSPNSPTPGFKQPRRAQVEWISAMADSPTFKKLGGEMVRARRTGHAIGAILGDAAIGDGGFMAGVNLIEPVTFDLRLLEDYEVRKDDHFAVASWTRPWGVNPRGLLLGQQAPVHEQSSKDPAAAAAAIGAGFAFVGTPAVPYAALGSFKSNVMQNEITARLAYGSTMILSGTIAAPIGVNGTPLAGVSAPLTTIAMAFAGTPTQPYLPYEQVKPLLAEQLETDYLRQARNTVLSNIAKEIGAINKAKDQIMLDKYLADMIQKYDLQTGKSAPLTDDYSNRFSLANDPGLAPLREAYLEPPSDDAAGRRFDMQLLTAPQPWAKMPENYDADFMPFNWKSADRAFMYWRTQDRKAEVVPVEDAKRGKAVRAEVERAWRFNKARDLAKKQAETLLEQARKEKGDKQGLRDFSKQNGKNALIELDGLARFNRERNFTDAMRTWDYKPPRIPDNKVPNTGDERERFDRQTGMIVPGQTPFADKILGLRSKPKGDGVVVADQPEAVFYVAVLMSVDPPSERDFYEIYRDAATQVLRQDALFAQEFEPDRYKKYREELMERLRKEAKLEVNKEKLDMYGGSTTASDE